MDVATVAFTSYEASIREALDALDASRHLAMQTAILIKPNVVNSSPHPVTTAPSCCAAIIKYIQHYTNAEIVIGEGCGEAGVQTGEVFDRLGYTDLADEYGVRLVDLNDAPLRVLKNPACTRFRQIHLPEIAFTHYVISVPVLKAHSLAGMTGTLKNMMGFAPPKFYSGQYGVWKKALFHHQIQRSIAELNSYLVPDLSVMDASIGLAEYHLGGAWCEPPVNRIIAGYDPWRVDQTAAHFLGLDWQCIGHLAEKIPPSRATGTRQVKAAEASR